MPSRGRSYLELVLGLVMLALLLGASSPALGRLLQRSRSSAGAGEIASVLAEARERARAHGEVYGVMFLRAPDRWLLWRDDEKDGWGNRRPDPEEILRGPVPLREGVAFGRASGLDPITFVGEKLLFRKNGTLWGLPGSVYVQGGDTFARVTVIRNGRIRIDVDP